VNFAVCHYLFDAVGCDRWSDEADLVMDPQFDAGGVYLSVAVASLCPLMVGAQLERLATCSHINF